MEKVFLNDAGGRDSGVEDALSAAASLSLAGCLAERHGQFSVFVASRGGTGVAR